MNFDTAEEALFCLGQNYMAVGNGVLRPRWPGYEPTWLERYAINYLVFEWDFALDETPIAPDLVPDAVPEKKKGFWAFLKSLVTS